MLHHLLTSTASSFRPSRISKNLRRSTWQPLVSSSDQGVEEPALQREASAASLKHTKRLVLASNRFGFDSMMFSPKVLMMNQESNTRYKRCFRLIIKNRRENHSNTSMFLQTTHRKVSMKGTNCFWFRISSETAFKYPVI